ncbi:ABC transporter permease subunit [Gemmobacter sp.]|uniref:ABC transporter permease subunit n=1 Tax=Gemmobacter sp. TaxID=1898957 RepID=UPI002AFF02FD|nr:ABC transporter permease subunit [Gemmobacter sp.]
MSLARTKARRAALRLALMQGLAFAGLGLGAFWLFHITLVALEARGIRTGLDFLLEPARSKVANAPFDFRPGEHTNGAALIAGALNTLKITAACIVLCSVLGLAIGLGRLARHALVARVCAGLVEGVRNLPVLIQLSIWYMLLLSLPGPRVAEPVAGGALLLSNRGIYLAFPAADPLWLWSAGLLVLVLAGGWRRMGGIGLAGFGGVAVCLPWLVAGHLPVVIWPEAKGLRTVAGLSVTPEFAAFVLALSIYTATFVAEIVRAAILAVPRGQVEAAQALALRPGTARRSVIYPQALRIALPSLGNEYLGVLKNSSLAVVVGYQEIVGVGNTVMFDTGQTVEVMGLLALYFLAVSLLVSAGVNWLNLRGARGLVR